MSFGRYEAVGELGRGGMGVVLRARSPEGQLVAIKVLHSHRALSGRERFEREMRLLASLGAVEGFVPVLETGSSPRGLYIVMPLLEGGTLRDRLRRGELPVPEVVALGARLGRALGEAHARGIVHRDLKPENVLLDGEGRAFVADLGLAKHFDDRSPGASQSVSLSVAGEIRGTAGYMAPEQMRDAKSVGPASDVFSLGAILRECLTGTPAFEASTIFQIVELMERGPERTLAAERPDAPRWLAAVIERALEREPAARYADGAELAAAIERKDPGRAAAGGRRRLVAGSLVGALALASALALAARSAPGDPGSRAAAAPERAAPDPRAELLARLRAGTCGPDELAQVASVPTGAALLGKLAADAEALPLPTIRAAAASLSRSHELAVLEAIATIASSSDPRERLRAIERARRAAPEGLAVRLFDGSTAVLSVIATAKARHEGDAGRRIAADALETALAPLAERPALIGWAIAPLASECRTAVVMKELGGDVIGTVLRETRTLETALDQVPPEVALAYICFAGTWKGTPGWDGAASSAAMALELDRRVHAVEDRDPLLAAVAESRALGSTFGFAPGSVRQDPRFDELYARARALVDHVLAPGVAVDPDETHAAEITLFLIARRRAQAYAFAASRTPPGETRLERFGVALDAERAAVSVMGSTRFALDPEPWHDLVAMLLAVGQADEAHGDSYRLMAGDPLFPLLKEDRSVADVYRKCGEILVEHADGPHWLRVSALAIHARAARRLGRLEEALRDEGDPPGASDDALLAAAAFDGCFGAGER